MENKIQIQTNNLKFSLFNIKNFTWLYLYNDKYSIFLKTNSQNKLSVLSSQTIVIENRYKNSIFFFKKTILYKYIKQISSFNFIKIKFSGKGYKIKKNNKNNLMLLFNRAHITHLWWKNIILKKLKKYKLYLRYTQNNKIVIKTITKIRSINVFTKKGLRQSKQILFKKKGKK